LKMPESSQKSDLVSLLKSIPLHQLNRSTSMEALPPSLLTDLRYITLRPSTRDPLIEIHISTLQQAPDAADVDPEEQATRARERQERERRKAISERQMQVQKEKRKAMEALEYSKGRMRKGEDELQRALNVGKQGLMGYMDVEDAPPPLPPLPPASQTP
ncbi:MAG: hypothetical protein Q9174_005865, partial [Haloplaca sp. 1 TL-2023]